MENVFALLQKIIPEGMKDLKNRYYILENIAYSQPIGRRALSAQTEITERILRSETELMKQKGLIESSPIGMKITYNGQVVLDELFPIMQQLRGLSQLEEELCSKLSLKKVIVVPGNVDEDESVKSQLGQAGAILLKQLLKQAQVIAVTGGSTILHTVKAMPHLHDHYDDLVVVPARGSVGGKVEYQANTLVVELANKLGAKYNLLNLPDNLSQQTINSIKKEPQVQKTLQKVEKTDIIIFGIGNALKMAKRREVLPNIVEMLHEKGALSEMFGYYFDVGGNVVYSTPTIGIDIDNALSIETRIAIAGGKSKALAIYSVHKMIKDSYLIIDEAAANEIVSLCDHE